MVSCRIVHSGALRVEDTTCISPPGAMEECPAVNIAIIKVLEVACILPRSLANPHKQFVGYLEKLLPDTFRLLNPTPYSYIRSDKISNSSNFRLSDASLNSTFSYLANEGPA